MRHLSAALLLACLLLVVGCNQKHPLIGSWKTVDAQGAESIIYFHADHNFDAIGKGEKLSGTWSIDEEQQPQRLELNFEDRKVVTIFRLEGDQLLIEPREKDQELATQFSEKAQKYRRQQ